MSLPPERDDLLETTLAGLAANPDRPAAMAAFDQALRGLDRIDRLRADPRKKVGQVCNFAPDELILAAGAIPLRLDGAHPLPSDPGRHMPVDVCCAVRALAALGPSAPLPVDLTVVPTACDGKKKLADLLGADRAVLRLELPHSKRSERSGEAWRYQIRILIQRLEALTGQRITRRSLRRAIDLLNRRTELMRAVNLLRRAERPPISGPDAFVLMQAAFLSEPAWWIAQAGVLLAELEQRRAAGRGRIPRARLLVTGSPILWPDYKLLLAVQAAGADVVADEMCSGTQRLHHPTVVDEPTRAGLIRAAGERVLLPCTCPCFAESEDRRDRLAALIREQRIDGVIHHTLRNCQGYDIDAIGLGHWLSARAVPFLSLHAEFGPAEAPGLQNRIEAFVEMVSQRAASHAGAATNPAPATAPPEQR